jgi:hypothetical protein
MAEAKPKLVTSKANGKTIKRRANVAADSGNRASGDGAARLRQAADKWVDQNSGKLIRLLTAKALKGDLASLKALASLAEGKKPLLSRMKKRRGLSTASRLASEPEWPGAEQK